MAQKVKVSPDLIGGDVDEGYGKVVDVFRRNLGSGQEVGAAFAVYRDGRKVVDLWGGYRNGITQAPWEQGTLVNVFSTTKGVASLAVAVAASRGLISYDARVADYWPEFAQASKDAITVRQLLSHQAGLPAIKPPLTLHDLGEPTKMSAKLAAQAPAWTPGTRHGYHAFTVGWYEGELIRRADPAGRSLGQFFAEEIAKPLGLDFYIGLPASVERNRVASLARLPPSQDAAAPQHNAATVRGRTVQSFRPHSAGHHHRQRDQRRCTLQPRRAPGARNARRQRHRHRAVDRQTIWQRRHRRFRDRLNPKHPRCSQKARHAADKRTARQGVTRRHDVLPGLYQTLVPYLSSVPRTMRLERLDSAARSDSLTQTPASDTAM